MTTVLVLANIAALRSSSGASANPVVSIEGYATPADGGEGTFIYVPTDTSSADNSGTVVVNSSGNRYYRATNHDALNICWFGAVANSTSDSSTALLDALAALPSTGGRVLFPQGSFTFASQITYTTPTSGAADFAVSFVGLGADVSYLNWPSTSGLHINISQRYHSLHVSDLSIVTGQASSQTIGVSVALANYDAAFGQNDFTNVTFRGTTPASQYWGYCIAISGLSNVNYSNLLMYGGNTVGNGISIGGGSAANTTSIIHNVTDCGFFNCASGFIYGNNTQGVTISQSNFTGGLTGIIENSGPGGFQFTVSDCQFNTTNNQIIVQTSNEGVSITGNLFFVPNVSGQSYTGINFPSATYIAVCSIVGNAFVGVAPTGSYTGVGVIAGSNTNAGVVTGNSFTGLSVGVDLAGSNWNVQANVYGSNVSTKVIVGSGNSVGVATE